MERYDDMVRAVVPSEFAPTFHHIGIAVRDVAASRHFFCGTLGMQVDSEVVDDPHQRVRLQMLRSGFTLVELVQPLPVAAEEEGATAANAANPVDRILRERDESMYHFCLEVNNLDGMLRQLVGHGSSSSHEGGGGGKCTLVSPPAPAPLFGMRKVAFVFVHDTNNLVEFLERSIADPDHHRAGVVPAAEAPVVLVSVPPPPPAAAGKIVVSSTFTADPIADVLSFWSQKLHVEDSTAPHDVVLTDFNSVFQQLLQPASEFCLNTTGTGMNVVAFRFDDFLTHQQQPVVEGHHHHHLFPSSSSSLAASLTQATEDFCNAMEAYFKSMGQDTPLFVIECKPSPSVLTHHKTNKIVGVASAKVQACMEELGKEGHKAFYLSWADVDEAYPLGEATPYYSAASDTMASLPYTDEYFCAVGTALMRRYWAEVNRDTFKAFVMDCDNTLWEGVVSEQSPASLSVKGSFVDLQTILKHQRQKGRLICLASMNDEKDVLATFDLRSLPSKSQDPFIVNPQNTLYFVTLIRTRTPLTLTLPPPPPPLNLPHTPPPNPKPP
jgi:catechol 2,3-dioxygenase-like lactoylglutathione lyase family enzyme